MYHEMHMRNDTVAYWHSGCSSVFTIVLETRIRAPIERVFDLARSIDAHIDSSSRSGEVAVAGRTSGLIGLGETVTWSAVHFGFRQRLTVEITEFERPHFFVDCMVAGAFKSMHHRHEFIEGGDHTIMNDVFTCSAPFGLVGKAVELLVLRAYMEQFLVERNERLKTIAEGTEWRSFV